MAKVCFGYFPRFGNLTLVRALNHAQVLSTCKVGLPVVPESCLSPGIDCKIPGHAYDIVSSIDFAQDKYPYYEDVAGVPSLVL